MRRRVLPMLVTSAALVVAVALAALLRVPQPRAGGPGVPRELWFYQNANLADAAAIARTEALWRRAAAAGYSHVVLSDAKFARLDSQGADYFAHVRALRALADSLRLEIVPGVCPVGREGDAMLEAAPDLAEALPVRDALLEVRGGVARVVADPPVALAARPDRVDAGAVVQSGEAVIAPGSSARIAFELEVSPFRAYHVSVQLRSEGFRGEPRIRVTGSGLELAFASIRAPSGAAAETRDVAFNSLGNHHVTVGFSLGRGATGTLHWSDWRIEEAGPVNVVNRPGMAFSIAGLEPGRDFDPVRDPRLGASPAPGHFDAWHEPPQIRVRRPDGTRLRASWYGAAVVLRGQVACCLSDTAALARLRGEITRTRELFGARTLMLMHDEIRTIGWDAPCASAGGAGEILAANVRACRAFAGDARVCVWNDMFDPAHNAVRDYYLDRGDLAGAWNGIDSSVVIVNWNGGRLDESLRFFAARGCRQVFAGYYDGPVDAIRDVLPKLDGVPGVTGVMYATWQERWDDLERFAAIVRGR